MLEDPSPITVVEEIFTRIESAEKDGNPLRVSEKHF